MGIGDMYRAQIDAEDAKRYRYLRDYSGNSLLVKLKKIYFSAEWDAVIDRAMKREAAARMRATSTSKAQSDV